MQNTIHKTENGFILLLEDGSRFVSNNKEIILSVASFLNKEVDDQCDKKAFEKPTKKKKKVDSNVI